MLNDLTVSATLENGVSYGGQVLADYVALTTCDFTTSSLRPGGLVGDGRQSVLYDPNTGTLAIDNPMTPPKQDIVPGFVSGKYLTGERRHLGRRRLEQGRRVRSA